MKEGNILSFRILIDSNGHLVTELSGLPENEIHRVFNVEDRVLVKKVIKEGRLKLEKMHNYLESELDALR